MNTRIDQADESRALLKAPTAPARGTVDRPIPDVVVSKTVTVEKKSASSVDAPSPRVSDRQARIALAAYYLAERRGFEPGHETADWLAAESQIDSEPV